MATNSLNLPPQAPTRFWRYAAIGVGAALLVSLALWPQWGELTSKAYMPHGYCLMWKPSLVLLHSISDALISLSYITISLTLGYLVYRARREIPFEWMFLAFGVFIIACGLTHLMGVLTLWEAYYWLAGDIKAITAVASVATAVVLPGTIPRVLRLIESARDSERTRELHEALVALAESDRRLRVAAHAANVAIFEWHIASGKVTWSEELERLYGRAPGSLAGDYRNWLESIHPDDRERVRRAALRAASHGGEYQVEFRVVWPDGSMHWIAARGQAINDSRGRPDRVIGINLDVTQRKQTEDILRSSERFAAMGRLAGTIAHEINNPLEAMNNLLYLLDRSDGVTGEAQQYVKLAREELQRITHISRQTLSFYRESPEPLKVPLASIMTSVLELYHRRIEQKRIAVQRDFHGEGEVLGFPGQMRQVFSNLVVNALEALPEGGRLAIRIRPSRSWKNPAQHGVRVLIADTGSGIARDARYHLFEPFFTTKGEKGTGIGLWVSNGIVQKHGGYIRLRSRVGPERSGTVFSIFLPDDGGALRGSQLVA